MDQQSTTSIKTIQIIAAALIMGVVIFAGFAVVIQSGAEADPQDEGIPILLIAASVFTVMELGARQVMMMVFDKKLKQEIEEYRGDQSSAEQFLGLFQTRTIISFALCEGAAFFGVIVYIIEGHPGGLGLAGFLVALMAISFPTENKFRSWVRSQSGQSAYAGEE